MFYSNVFGEFLFILFIILFVRLYRRRLIETKRNEDLKEEIEILIAEIGETKPFSAMGFFNVERSCLITVLATAFTYVIVLLQGV